MPQSSIQVANAGESGIHLTRSVNALACLASGLRERTWNNYKVMQDDKKQEGRSQALPSLAVRRLVNWYKVANTAIKRYNHVAKGQELWWLKENLHLWVSHKKDVLKDALDRGDILQIDVLNAVVCDCSSRNFSYFIVLRALTLYHSSRSISSN